MKADVFSYKGASILIWKMDESISDLLANLQLSDKEKEHYNSITSEKRKQEFLSVRYALKQLLNKDTSLVYDESGKPFLTDNSFQVSVSHSGRWLALIVHPDKKVGIDIEIRVEKTIRLAPRFLNEEEQKYLHEQQIALAWGAKESLFKILGTSAVDFSNQLRVLPFEFSEEDGIFQTEHTVTGIIYDLGYHFTGSFFLVYVVDSSDAA